MPVYRNFFLFLNFVPALINTYGYYISVPFSIFLAVYPCFAFKKYTGTSKFPYRVLGLYQNFIDYLLTLRPGVFGQYVVFPY
jgi:hypothetical protein